MSSIVGAITGGGDSGMNFRAKQADLIQAATKAQADQQYGNVQTGLQQQQDFLKAVQAQNGLQNQTNTFNQLQGVADGTGPNPAQMMLNNATGANVANQAALMAGQRGSGANAGLIARQAGMQGAGIQQQAAGQGAALQAQQSLGALNQMGGIAGQQAGQQANATNAYTAGAQGAQSNILNAINGLNTNAVSSQNNANSVNGTIANNVATQQGNLVGNITGAAGSALNFMGAGQGLKGIMAGGGGAGGQIMAGGAADATGIEAAAPFMLAAEGGTVGPKSYVAKHFATGGKVPAMVSPGEKYLDPKDVQQVEQGANPMTVGEKIPGKPKVGGAKNSYQNDTVPKTLEEGGIVLPRSVTQSKDPAAKAAEFVAAVLKRQALKAK